MNKTVIIIEDKLDGLKPILSVIRDIFIMLDKQDNGFTLKNANVKICVLRIIGEGQDEDKDKFKKIESSLGMEIDAGIEYEYIPVPINTQDYPGVAEEELNKICSKVSELCEGRDYSIMLDVVLVPNQDYTAIKTDKILSQRIYESFSDKCIPYTNYGEGDTKFRQKWIRDLPSRVRILERWEMDGSAIPCSLFAPLCSHLGIGMDRTDE